MTEGKIADSGSVTTCSEEKEGEKEAAVDGNWEPEPKLNNI